MKTRKPIIGTKSPAARLLLTACGFAGCTGGPAVSSTPAESPLSVAASTEERPKIGTARQISLPQRPAYAANSIWARSVDVGSGPTDPFAVAGASRRSADGKTARPVSGGILPVSHAECGSPNLCPASTGGRNPGVVRVKDGRLPPAAPLGVANPFVQETQPEIRRPTPAATPVVDRATRVVAKPVSSQAAIDAPGQPKINARTSSSPVPIGAFLNRQVSINAARSRPVQNDDMIVESNLLRKRSEWRNEILPSPSEADPTPFPIAPRRPFSAPGWEDPAPAVATANIPIEISPSQPPRAEQVSFPTVSFETNEFPSPEPTQPPSDETDEPASADGNPFATSSETSDNPFADLESREFAESAKPASIPKTELAAAPFMAPTASESLDEAPAPPADTDDEPGPMLVASAVPEKAPLPPAERTTDRVVSPLELDEANRIVAEEAKSRPEGTPSTPLAIGLALAAVAVGAVLIRRRFS